MNPATDISACATQTECFAFHIDTRTTTSTDTTFFVPTSGYVGGASNHSYDWIVDWGDGTSETQSGTSDISGVNSDGIAHDYASTGNVAGEYQITIRPNNTANAGWLNAFGYSTDSDGANANANKYKFHSIDTPFTNLMRTQGATYRFANIFYNATNGLGIPTNLFAYISTAGDANLSSMFLQTFDGYARNSTTATIPAGLFDHLNTSSATNMNSMFSYTFHYYAQASTIGTVPADLFNSIDTNNVTNSSSSMFYDTFELCMKRQAQFVIAGSVVYTYTYYYLYAVKIGVNGASSYSPTVSRGDVIYPTYSAATVTINPSFSYATYSWYTKDGTSCAAANPTADCGVQDNTTLAALPNSTLWTSTMSTEEAGNATYYGAYPISISATSPNRGFADTAGRVITITGNNFNTAASVTVGGSPCVSYTIASNTSISCVLPPFSTVGHKPVVIKGSNNVGIAAVPRPGGPASYTVVDQYIEIAANGTVPITIIPNRFSSNKSIATVSTNSPNGYVLSMQASSTNLTKTTTPTGTISTIASSYTPAAPSSATNTSNLIGSSSFWGYRVTNQDSFGTTTAQETNSQTTAYSWATIPTTDTTVRTGTTTDDLTTNVPQTTDIWFGVSATLDRPPGTYVVEIIYTVAPNLP
jgi:hypothetical protein